MYRMLCIFAVVALCLSTVPSSAELYRWVDEKGIQHFSNEPPPKGAVRDVEEAPETPYDAKADEASNAHDKAVMDDIMSQEPQGTDAAGTDAAEPSTSPAGGSDQDSGQDVTYEGDGGPGTDVLGINDPAENAPERKKELQEAEESHEDGETRPHTEHSDDVLGVNEPAEEAGARKSVEHHQGGHGGKK